MRNVNLRWVKHLSRYFLTWPTLLTQMWLVYPMSKSNALLINEHPLQVLPSLAVAVGLEPAIILQQLHYWLTKPGVQIVDDLPWVYNTYQKWHQQFPFMTVKVIGNAFRKLENAGLVKSGNHNSDTRNRTKWYTIDYDALEGVAISLTGHSNNVPERTMEDDESGHSSLAETTTTETTSETSVKTATPSLVKITMDTLESVRGYPPGNYGAEAKRSRTWASSATRRLTSWPATRTRRKTRGGRKSR